MKQMKINDILKVDNILMEYKGDSKNEVLNEIIDSLANDPRILNLDVVRQVVFERENIMSTGVGSGFAIPHGKTNSVTELVGGFCFLKNPIEFDSFDKKPVNIIFLLVGREDKVGQHLKVLSRISRIMNQAAVRTKIENANNSQDILQILEEEENKYIELS